MRYRRLRRGISPAVTTLILLGLAVLAGVIAGVVLMSQMHAVTSKGASLQVTVDARDVGNGYTAIVIHIKNVGYEAVRVDNIYMYKEGSTRPFQSYTRLNVVLRPGETYDKDALVRTGLQAGSTIYVKVTGTALGSGKPIVVYETADITP